MDYFKVQYKDYLGVTKEKQEILRIADLQARNRRQDLQTTEQECQPLVRLA